MVDNVTAPRYISAPGTSPLLISQAPPLRYRYEGRSERVGAGRAGNEEATVVADGNRFENVVSLNGSAREESYSRGVPWLARKKRRKVKENKVKGALDSAPPLNKHMDCYGYDT